ncbi:hypothetical protein HanPI659440_Chr14g0544101 [Helianthus annuus]|nr:hypothetical protein HanHA300_Chr14g0515761 [Helianthus annuus]KAJ0484910.1 hypothetical protein HanHA89_Chr14g0562151 [Helianthus annuus]KAJ0655460.1 hypothetical protein HanLR1_Chr14g0524471 [Helianthus annuus]KAJ0659153.1 hypothetical protein HanOQP8_Chr14g0522791 [Helianthus annuus]KAJ0702830.1 hypothetical protein HanPI659440_Chr14g0544101 [Helianthus annuus]
MKRVLSFKEVLKVIRYLFLMDNFKKMLLFCRNSVLVKIKIYIKMLLDLWFGVEILNSLADLQKKLRG